MHYVRGLIFEPGEGAGIQEHMSFGGGVSQSSALVRRSGES